MRQVRAEIEVRQGVKVGMLFTPRLYSFKGHSGVTLEMEGGDLSALYSAYADIMFCAALNLWTLEGRDIEDAPFTRVDFHEFSALYPKEFGKAFSVAFEALTGKSMKDFAAEQKKTPETAGKAANAADDVKKKNRCGWITRLLRRS